MQPFGDTSPVETVVALISSRPLDGHPLCGLFSPDTLMLGAYPGYKNLCHDQGALAPVVAMPGIGITRFWHFWHIIRIDPCPLHHSIRHTTELWIGLRLSSDLNPSILGLFNFAHSLSKTIDACGHCTNVATIGSNMTSNDNNVGELLPPRSTLGELLDLRVRLKQADDSIGLTAVSVHRIGRIEKHQHSSGHSYGVRVADAIATHIAIRQRTW
mmetsp:Transcript_80453/g.98539  ORF Transcript_80453/g.98539 Transcript_80453/m.98539 type:complete len:214 (-) Transcript_80453:238-879(-)